MKLFQLIIVLSLAALSLAAPVADGVVDMEEVFEKKIVNPTLPPEPTVAEGTGELKPTPDANNNVGPTAEGEKLTVNSLDGYLNLIVQMFRGVLPQDLTKTIENLNLHEKGELVGLISDWYQGKIKRPENRAAIVALIKDKLPSVYEKIDNLNTTFYKKYNNLKPETQTILSDWKNKFLDLPSTTPAESARKQIQLFKDFGLAIQNLKEDVKNDLRSQFPTAVNLLDSFGFAIITSLAMIVQKVVESFGPTGVPPVECAIPLD